MALFGAITVRGQITDHTRRPSTYVRQIMGAYRLRLASLRHGHIYNIINTNRTVHLFRTTRDLHGIRTDMSSWRLSFAGRLIGANKG